MSRTALVEMKEAIGTHFGVVVLEIKYVCIKKGTYNVAHKLDRPICSSLSKIIGSGVSAGSN